MPDPQVVILCEMETGKKFYYGSEVDGDGGEWLTYETTLAKATRFNEDLAVEIAEKHPKADKRRGHVPRILTTIPEDEARDHPDDN